MTTRLVHRPARTVRPSRAPDPIELAAPPTLSTQRNVSALQSMLPLAGAALSMSMMLFMRGSAFVVLGAVIMVASVGAAAAFYLSQRGAAHRARRDAREAYLAYLDDLSDRLRTAEADLVVEDLLTQPPTSRLLDVIRNPARIWERRRKDPDFLTVRIAAGSAPRQSLSVRGPDNAVTRPDPFLDAEAAAVVERFSSTPNVAVSVDLDLAGHVSVVSPDLEAGRALLRTILLQVCVNHAPDDVEVALIVDGAVLDKWRFARWLPHGLDRSFITATGPQPLVAADGRALVRLLRAQLSQRIARAAQSYRHGATTAEAQTQPRLLIVVDSADRSARELGLPADLSLPALGITVITLVADRLAEPSEVTTRVTLSADAETVSVEKLAAETRTCQGRAELSSLPWADGCARMLAPLRLSSDSYDDGTGTPPADFAVLLELSDITDLDLLTLWLPKTGRDFLRVPIGVTPKGDPLILDLKESAQLGMGPHGLCVGATGSGKSELLRDIVLALAVSHSPAQLNVMLVDYKGGATFAPFAALPHVAGLLTNLAADATLVERMYASLEGEVNRRQQVLADAGRLTDIVEYNLKVAEVGDSSVLEPMPNLVVIIDEFAELLTAKPEFIELFLRIGRIGRSIGVHLLLSSQRLEEGKLRGLEAYLSYRIALRTLSEAESRTVLGNADAFHLPAVPGLGLLQVDVSIYESFKSAYISGPLAEVEAAPSGSEAPQVSVIEDYGRPTAHQAAGPEPAATAKTTGPTLMSAIVNQLVGQGSPARAIWLAPLPQAFTLDQLGDGITVTDHGIRLRRFVGSSEASLIIPIGLVDDPARQWQGVWSLELGSAGGHAVIVGAPACGKTTALRTIALSLAATRTPQDVAVYAVDLLGNALRGLEELPNVGSAVGRDEGERTRRLFEEMQAELTRREALFERHRLDTVTELREARLAGVLPDLPAAEVVYLVDGYGQLGQQFESLESIVHDVLARGGRYGMHVVTTATRWSEVRGAQLASFGHRVELALSDPSESALDAKLARAVPADHPGRALTARRQFAQIALPRLDGMPIGEQTGFIAAARTLRGSYTGSHPPPIRTLPRMLPVGQAGREFSRHPGRVCLGIREQDLCPAYLDLFDTDQHLLVLGDTDTGKTNLLRLVVRALTSQCSSDDLVFAVFDPRRSMREQIDESYVGGYATNPVRAGQLAEAVAKQVHIRQADEGTGVLEAGLHVPAQPNGAHPASLVQPRVVLLIDDYDVLAASGTAPLGSLVPYLAAASDLGLHVVMTRRVMGAARGMFEPFTGAVRESGCLSLLLSGDRSEGLLFPGVRPRTLPPGRAQLIRPGEPVEQVQTSFVASTESVTP